MLRLWGVRGGEGKHGQKSVGVGGGGGGGIKNYWKEKKKEKD